MDDFDRERPSRSGDPRPRRRDTRDDPGARDSIRRRPGYGESPDPEPRRRQGAGFRDSQPSDADISQQRPSRTAGEPPSRPERYSDRFRRQRQSAFEEPEDRSFRSSRDPYDRLRRIGNRPPRQVDIDDDQALDFEHYRDDEPDLIATAGRPSRRPARQRTARLDQQRFREMSAVFANPTPEFRPLMMGGLVAVVSLILLSILVLARSGSAGDWIPLHLNAEGTPTGFGTTATLWRLPFFALLATIMAFGLAWWLRAREAYAVQYLVVGALLIHCLIWVGAINLLW